MIETKRPRPRHHLVALLPFALASCSSGGGRSDSGGWAAPVIIAASYTGSGVTPSSGDTLVLAFSQTITLSASSLLTDADVSLPSGDSLGAVSAAPSRLSSNAIAISLGPGVTLEPGVSTIRLSAGNDVIGGLNTPPQGGGEPVIIGADDGVAPTVANVTIADIDDELNGTGAAGGTLQVPTNGWELDLAYTDNSAIATSMTVVTADVTVSSDAGPQLAGANLAPLMTELSATNSAASYRTPASMQFPEGPVTLTVIVADIGGLSSTPTEFSFTVRPFTAALQPFETDVNASQVWFLDFSRDLESYTAAAISGGVAVQVTSGANGASDFDDLMQILGMTNNAPIGGVQGGLNSNEVVIGRIKDEVVADLEAFHSGANVTFTLAQPPGSFGGNTSVTYASLGYSSISIAGQASIPGVLGVAIFDPSNASQNDNTATDFGGSSERLGVFLHTIVNAGMGPPSTSNFRTTFDTFAPSLGGTPIGDAAQDGGRLIGAVGDAREGEIDAAIDALARFTASVTAHECGHSVGLVANSPMPLGLYGNDSVNFPGSANGHIRTQSLFPAGSINLMSPSLSYTTATSSATQFNTLNMAYLREQVFYGN